MLLQMTISLDHGIVTAQLTKQLGLIESVVNKMNNVGNTPAAVQRAQDVWEDMKIVFVVPPEIADDFRLQKFTNFDNTQRVRGIPAIAQWVLRLDRDN